MQNCLTSHSLTLYINTTTDPTIYIIKLKTSWGLNKINHSLESLAVTVVATVEAWLQKPIAENQVAAIEFQSCNGCSPLERLIGVLQLEAVHPTQ